MFFQLLWRVVRRTLSTDERRILELLLTNNEGLGEGLSRDCLLEELGVSTKPCAERAAAIKVMQGMLYRGLVRVRQHFIPCWPGFWYHVLTITPRGRKMADRHQISCS